MPISRSIVVISAIISMVVMNGCVAYMGDRTPNLVAKGYKPTLAKAPRIDVILHHRHTLDGEDSSGDIVDDTYKTMKKSFARVQKETPFLANAKQGNIKSDFVLDLDTEIAEHGEAQAIITGVSLLLIPGFFTSDVIVRGTLKTPDGKTISHREATGQLKLIIQLGLLPVLPALPFIVPGKELYDDTFRDVFIQMEQDLEKLPTSR